MRTRVPSALLLVAAVACAPAEPPGAPVTAVRRVVATFSGVADAGAGTVTIEALPPEPAALPDALTVVTVVQDGVPGVGPRDTVELVTVSAASQRNGCRAGVDSFEGDVILRSFFPLAQLQNAHVELTQLAPAGHESCNSTTTPPAGTSNALGLWAYGTVGFAGSAGDAVTVRWKFRLPDQAPFTFRGRVVADVVDTAATPPSATLSLLDAAPKNVNADGVSTATLTATVVDAGGVPLPQRTVAFSVTGTNNVLSAAQATTDAAGVAAVTLASTTAETKTITAVVDPGPSQVQLAQQPTVRFR